MQKTKLASAGCRVLVFVICCIDCPTKVYDGTMKLGMSPSPLKLQPGMMITALAAVAVTIMVQLQNATGATSLLQQQQQQQLTAEHQKTKTPKKN
jgi:type 1 fimbria pilin